MPISDTPARVHPRELKHLRSVLESLQTHIGDFTEGMEETMQATQAEIDSIKDSMPGPQPRIEFYDGVTDSTGTYAVTFHKPFNKTPEIKAQIIGGTYNNHIRVVSVSPTGFEIKAGSRTGLSVLGVTVLSAEVSAQSGVKIDVRVTERP